MQQESDLGGHDHSHGHSHEHDHGHINETETKQNEPAANEHKHENSGADIIVDPIDTPNPNAYKFSVDRKVAKNSFSANNPEQASATPLAAALFELDGVIGVFGVNDFVTVTKNQETEWGDLIPKAIKAIQKTLAD